LDLISCPGGRAHSGAATKDLAPWHVGAAVEKRFATETEIGRRRVGTGLDGIRVRKQPGIGPGASLHEAGQQRQSRNCTDGCRQPVAITATLSVPFAQGFCRGGTGCSPTSASSTSASGPERHLRRSCQPVGLQLLQRKPDLQPAGQFLSVLQLHQELLDLHQRLRRPVQ
jgi:hypothetical protein